ncbi:MAG: hypothetical protein ACP5LE_03955, partial [Thermoplasmata archaeon]
ITFQLGDGKISAWGYVVEITIQLYVRPIPGEEVLCDITKYPWGDTKTLHLTYNCWSGRWGGDDWLGDSSGYRQVDVEEDGNPGDEDDHHMWFDIWQTDLDGDGIPYGYEVDNNLNPVVNDGNKDMDNDGMTNRYEYYYGLNLGDPSDANIDSDGDSFSNLWEARLNRDPLDGKTVFKISLKVSLEWNANQGEISMIVDAFKGATLYLFTATDGYVYISDVVIYNNKAHWGGVEK